ncbi:MAG TPA: acyltransferase [Isosphaeraceae bacterium]|nr:acyltransferase [Isosphaeraceae bacterium]
MTLEETRRRVAPDRFLPSGDEIGTAPGDRKFRPDVEGLRAVAIGLVVLFHAGVPGITGGFVGVDVFFVISGFVITGVLLRERAGSGRNSILAFYGRRARRIIPAATLVIVVTVLATYHWLGFILGGNAARDGRAAATFWVNFHFIATGTNYWTSQLPPSPLQNFWSLSVEEQFYVVYPALFIAAAVIAVRRLHFHHRINMILGAGIVVSFLWSILQTSSNATAAYFSPFTRAWELALGALVAANAGFLASVPQRVSAMLGWAGFGGILLTAFVYTSATPYPGYAAALPVVSTAAVIAGGTAGVTFGAETVLGLPPFQWLGKVSYSFYLWHWPLLVIPMEIAGHPLSLKDNMGWVAVALTISVATYFLLENPIRHAKKLRQSWRLSIGLGAVLVATSVAVTTFEIASHP